MKRLLTSFSIFFLLMAWIPASMIQHFSITWPDRMTAVAPSDLSEYRQRPSQTDLPQATTLKGLPFGPVELPEEEYGDPFTVTLKMLEPETALESLENARAAGFHLFINLAGPSENYQEPDLSFSLSLFKERLDLYQDIDFAPYVEDGTVLAHLLFDEPHNPSGWGGQLVPYEDIEAAAAYSKELFPTIPIGIGGLPGYLQGGAPWANLEMGLAQYSTQRGDLAEWLAEEVNAANQSNLNLILSLNVTVGNEGGSMTPEQILEWGSMLASEPKACALLLFTFEAEYFMDVQIRDAIKDVAEVAFNRSAPSCHRLSNTIYLPIIVQS